MKAAAFQAQQSSREAEAREEVIALGYSVDRVTECGVWCSNDRGKRVHAPTFHSLAAHLLAFERRQPRFRARKATEESAA